MSILFLLICLATGLALVFALKGRGAGGGDTSSTGGADPWRSDATSDADPNVSNPSDSGDASSGGSD